MKCAILKLSLLALSISVGQCIPTVFKFDQSKWSTASESERVRLHKLIFDKEDNGKAEEEHRQCGYKVCLLQSHTCAVGALGGKKM